MTRFEPLHAASPHVPQHDTRSVTLPGGLRLPYVEQGHADGLPVLLLHGYTDSLHSFEPVLPHLPGRLRVLALTQRGHGDADRPESGYATADFVADIAAFLDAMGIERALLFGHSMGAAHAIAFAAAHPGRVRGLMLEGAFAGFRDSEPVMALWRQAVEPMRDPVDPAFARDFQLGTLAQALDEQTLGRFVGESLKLPARVWRAVCEGFLEDAALRALPSVRAPVRLLWGGGDAFASRADQERLLQALPGSTLEVYAGHGHALHWEDPGRVARDVVAFADDIAARGRALHGRLDARDTPVSETDPAALALYEQALGEYQSYVGDALATIDRALAARPAFVLGHVFRAGVLMSFGERRFARLAADSVVAAEALLERANERERGLVAATRRLVDGDWHAACAVFDRVLVDHPRDAFALQTAHLFDFFRGDALNLRNRVARVLPCWSSDLPGYSYVLGLHAFGLEECNQYPEAEHAARRALAIEPRDAWAVHAAVHCMEMQGRIDDGIEWLRARELDWSPDNGLAFHNWWHLALFHLDRGEDARVLELYDTRVYPQPVDVALQLVDATALLWRLRLLGVDVGARFEPLAAQWAAKLDEEGGFYGFNDVHAAMALVSAGRDADLVRLLHRIDEGFGADVGGPVARGLVAFGRGRHAEAIEHLLPVRDHAHRFGGSHAQRDVVTLTLIEAARRDGRRALARHVLADRRVQRPGSGLAQRLGALR